MKDEQLIEAALFVSTDPISLEKLARISGIGTKKVKVIVEGLKKMYEERGSAIEIRSIGDDQYIMQAKDIFAAPLLDLVKPDVSQEVLKTLSLVALKQPITQAEVVKSRGYLTYTHVKELVNKEFIHAEPKGRTKLLTTTKKFSDYFGFPQDIEGVKKELARQLEVGPKSEEVQ
jgi:segregation and condensation protein B